MRQSSFNRQAWCSYFAWVVLIRILRQWMGQRLLVFAMIFVLWPWAHNNRKCSNQLSYVKTPSITFYIYCDWFLATKLRFIHWCVNNLLWKPLALAYTSYSWVGLSMQTNYVEKQPRGLWLIKNDLWKGFARVHSLVLCTFSCDHFLQVNSQKRQQVFKQNMHNINWFVLLRALEGGFWYFLHKWICLLANKSLWEAQLFHVCTKMHQSRTIWLL